MQVDSKPLGTCSGSGGNTRTPKSSWKDTYYKLRYDVEAIAKTIAYILSCIALIKYIL